MNNFSDISISPELIAALQGRNILVPTPVQKTVIPHIQADENIIFQSETGTGKTLCYLLPAFMKCKQTPEISQPQILILAPTHELASQIKTEAHNLDEASGSSIRAALCIGGVSLKRQIETLREKPAILIGTPARLLELIRLKKLKSHDISMVVLDEVDRMLSPEMRDIIRDILAILPIEAQYIACSATISRYTASLLESMLPAKNENPPTKSKHRITLITLPPEDVLKRNISHWAFFSENRKKIDLLRKLILAEQPQKMLVFTSVAGQVGNIVSQLNYRGIPCSGLYAKLNKQERKKNIDDFRSGRTTVMVASDLSARGLDIPNISHIVQLDVNKNEDFFIHRAGRTARAGKSGINIIFGDEYELRELARIEKKIGIVIYPKVLYGGKVRTPEQDAPDGAGCSGRGRMLRTGQDAPDDEQ